MSIANITLILISFKVHTKAYECTYLDDINQSIGGCPEENTYSQALLGS
jgi:hypothetical protein